MDSASLSIGSIESETISINGQNYTFSFEVIASTKPSINEQLEIDFSTNNFGELKSNLVEESDISINIKNPTRKKLPLSLNLSNLNRISSYTNCPQDGNLDRGRQCLINLKLKSIKEEDSKSIQEIISIADVNYNFSGTITKENLNDFQTEQKIEFGRYIDLNLSEINFGSINAIGNRNIFKKVLILKNNSRKKINPYIELSSLEHYYIGENTCTQELSRFQKCYIDVLLILV